MSTILEADETGALHLPPSLLPNPGPRRHYRVVAKGSQLLVDEEAPILDVSVASDHAAWLEELAERRARSATGLPGTPLQEIFDDLRSERC